MKSIIRNIVLISVFSTMLFALSGCEFNTSFLKTNLFPVKIEQKYGYIDKTGKLVIEPQFTFASDFSEDLAKVCVKNKYGYINKKGEAIIYPQYENADNFSEGVAPVQLNGKWGYINKSGVIVIEPQFKSAKAFNNDLAFVAINNKYGYINKMGKFIWFNMSKVESINKTARPHKKPIKKNTNKKKEDLIDQIFKETDDVLPN